MIDSVWRERRRLVWINAPLSGASDRWRFRALARAEKIWRLLKRAAPKPPIEQDPS
jgi:hypothetical protein